MMEICDSMIIYFAVICWGLALVPEMPATALRHEPPTAPAPFYTTEAAELILSQTYSTSLP